MSISVWGKDVHTAVVGQGMTKPVCFVENKGQLTDQNNHPLKEVQYKLSSPGVNLLLGSSELHYQFRKAEGTRTTGVKLNTYRMDVTLVGANKNAIPHATAPNEYYENYYLPQNGEQGVTAHSWNRITYTDVYPNIDWVVYVNDGKVEYDFVVRPGGHVGDIQLKYGGATKLSLAADGSLLAETPMGAVTEKAPVSFETVTGKAVASQFIVKNNVVRFTTDSYTGSLTIDPYLSWSTYFGGALEDVITAVRVSTGDTIYVCGYTSSTAGIATAGAYRNANAGGTFDMFMAKYSPGGVLKYCTYYGGSANDEATSLALDNSVSNPSVYVGGFTTSPNAPPGTMTGFTAYHGANNGGNDGFLVKFANNGTRSWATYFGGTADDFVYGVATDASGSNVYITGTTASSTLVSTAGAYQLNLSGTRDAFLAKFNSGGTIQWSTYYGGSALESGLGVVCDASGNIDITGQTNSVINMASAGAYQTTMSGTNDAFVAQFSAAGTRLWGTYFGGTGTEQANGIASDGSGNLAVVGNTTSPTGVASARAFQPAFGGVQDAFAAYFTNTGSLKWSSYFGGPALDYGQAVCFDFFDNVVLAGGTFSSSGIATANSNQAAIGGDYDAFIAKINPLGQTLWNSYFGGTFYDYANGIACDPNTGQLVMAGYTTSTGNYGSGGVATTGAQQTANAGGVYDAFVTKFDIDTLVTISQPYADTIVCQGGTLFVNYDVSPNDPVFQPGNVFTVEMSNASGSFAAPVWIGSVTATGSGAVQCTVPAGALGIGYRVRIRSSNPVFVSPDDYYDIHVVPLPSVGATTATSNSPSCIGGTIALNDAATYTIDDYSWSGPSGFSSTLQNPTISSAGIANAGVYTVSTFHNGCSVLTATVNVVVNSTYPPKPSVGVTVGCAGSTLSLTANADTTAPGITWHWSGPSSFTSTLQNPTITGATLANAGFYYVTDTFAGCPSQTRIDTVVVNPTIPVVATITASPGYTPGGAGDTICLGTMVNFNASIFNGGSSPTYQWYAGGSAVLGAISNTWSSASLTDGEIVQCVVNSSVLCPSPVNAGSNTIKMNVIDNAPLVYISAAPSAHVAPGSTVVFTSAVYNGGINAAYQWFKNGAAIAGATGKTYTLTNVNAPDTITLQVTSTMLCPVPDSTATSNVVIAESNVGVAHVAAELSGTVLFPNPTTGTFTVKGSLATSSPVTYEVSNVVGQSIQSGILMPKHSELDHTISLQNAANGIYILRLSQDGQSKTFRFAVERN